MFSVVFIIHLDLERMYEQSIKRSKKSRWNNQTGSRQFVLTYTYYYRFMTEINL